MTSLLIRNALVGGSLVDVACDGGRITTIGSDRSGAEADEVLDVEGHTLLPGLWDHHIHLMGLAASQRSLVLDAATVATPGDLADRLVTAHHALERAGWLRVVGYHESMAGDLDRRALDRIVADRPVRVQHRSGLLWMLNGAACRAIDLDAAEDPGIERDQHGATGRIFGADAWLRSQVDDDPPDLAAVGRRLTELGIVGVTDCTPSADPSSWPILADAVRTGALPQHVVVTGGPELAFEHAPEPLGLGPVKIHLGDHRLPGLDDLVEAIAGARAAERTVAFHSVTRASLVLALSALDAAGPLPNDRIEHGAVVPPELAEWVHRQGLTVVTQPGFLADRGDGYLAEVDADDQPHLYPCQTLLDRGIPVAASSDAPHGPLDPWSIIDAAVHRRTRGGCTVGAGERVDAAQALAMYLGRPGDPGGPARRVDVGQPADLVAVRPSLDSLLSDPSSTVVEATVIAGSIAHGR